MRLQAGIALILGALAAGNAAAQGQVDTLAGALPKVLHNPGHPYLVIADIEVPQDRMVVVEAGVVMLFKPFTGLHVQGRIEVQGTKASPVVFTSENDQQANPSSQLVANPYDWNGIYVHGDALGSTFDNVKVMYSVYGIMSETRFVRVDPGEFAENGKSNLLIEGTEHVTNTQAFTYALSTKDATVDGVPVRILRDPAAPRRNVLRYVGLGLLVLGAGAGVYETVQASRAGDELDALSNTDVTSSSGYDNLRYHSSQDWQEASDGRSLSIAGSIAGYVVAALGAVGVTWSFTF